MKKDRIVWIDVAKAIAILAMIVGHVVEYGNEVRDLIFSFHMPMFFVLTGLTMKPVNSWRDIGKQVKKDFMHIMLPCIIVEILNMLLSIVINGKEIGSEAVILLERLIWASAVDVYVYPAMGALWFLVVLFWTKLLFSVIQLLFPEPYNGMIFLASALFGKVVSTYVWLPQSFDIVLVCVIFVYAGHLLMKYHDFFERHMLKIAIIAFVTWMLCWQELIYIEIGTRSYPMFVLCIGEALAGCYFIFCLSKAIAVREKFAYVLSLIGRHTLLILCVHYLDWSFAFIWKREVTFYTCILRVVCDLAVTAVILLVAYLAKLGRRRVGARRTMKGQD